MSDDRRNPYVLLGLPYGATLTEARRAFARRARDARWGDHDVIDAADLEWALARIELEHIDAAAAFGTYRVPADASVLRSPAGFGLIAPAPRAASRRSPTTPDDERSVVFDAARLDAAQHLLDRTAAATGRRLERVTEESPVVATVAVPPMRRRGWLPVVLVGAAAAAVLAIAGISSLGGGDDAAAVTTTTMATTTTTAPATSTTTAVTIAVFGGEPGLGEPIEFGGIEVTPSDPLDGFGHLCMIFTIDGDVPLGFIRDQVTLISGGVAFEAALGITTGRTPNTDVFGDPAPAQREICFAVEGWQERNTDLVYATQVGNYRWSIGT